MKADLFAWVQATASIRDKLGGAGAPRWYYLAADPAAVRAADEAGEAYAIANVTSDPSHPHMAGVSAIRSATVSIDLWGTDVEAVDALGESLRSELDGLAGVTLGAATKLRRAFLTDDGDDVTQPDDGSRRLKFRRRMAFELWYATP